jgi:hypothetical protein
MGGRGEVPAVPDNVETVDGVPLGDCTVPTAEEQMAAGCPAEAPAEYSACNPSQVACVYDVSVSDPTFGYQYSQQAYFYCDNFEWYKSQNLCGNACLGRFEYALDFPSNCADREQINCEERDTVSYSIPPSSQTYLDDVIAAMVVECGGDLNYYMQFEFIDGCATHVTFEREQTPELLDCLSETLGTLKLDCAVNLTCSHQGSTPI